MATVRRITYLYTSYKLWYRYCLGYWACTLCVCACVLATTGLTTRGPGVTPIPMCGTPGYEIGNLTLRVWTFNATKDNCIHTNHTGNKCTFYMAFCGQVTKVPRLRSHCAGTSVCQENTAIPVTDRLFRVGLYEYNPFNATALHDTSGFVVDYPRGDPYPDRDGPCNLSITLVFLCNHNVKWDVTADMPVIAPIPGGIDMTYNQTTCHYHVEFQYSGACAFVIDDSSVLSPGSILLIIFFIAIMIYFTFGSAINVIRRTRGNDVIPHKVFWVSLPQYISLGCKFMLSGCGMSRSEPKYENI